MTSPHEAVVQLAKNGLLDHADLARHASRRHALRDRPPGHGSPATSLAKARRSRELCDPTVKAIRVGSPSPPRDAASRRVA